jgi:integrase
MAGKRGQYGNGSIDKAGDDTWRLRYRINGKRFAKHVTGTKAEAVKELRRLLAAADDGKHVAPSKLTVAMWIEEWLALKARAIKARTHERYAEMLAHHVTPVLGALPLQKVGARDIDKLYGGLVTRDGSRKLAPGSAQLLHVVVKSVFASAVKKKLIATNPVADAERPAGEAEADETILDEEELGCLVQGFRGHSLYEIVAVAAFTGMRRNEILALRLDADIDLDRGTISVTRNVEQVHIAKDGGDKKPICRIGTPKSKNSVREFQIDANLVALLRKVRDTALRIVAGVPAGADVDLALVRLPKDTLAFPAVGTLTTLRNPTVVTNGFKRRAAKLGFSVHLHDLRASHSTALLDRGVPVHVVAKRIGDDPATLLGHYAKRTKKADADAAAAVAALSKGVL